MTFVCRTVGEWMNYLATLKKKCRKVLILERKQKRRIQKPERLMIWFGQMCGVCSALILVLLAERYYELKLKPVWKADSATGSDSAADTVEFEKSSMEDNGTTEAEVFETLNPADSEAIETEASAEWNIEGNRMSWNLILVNPWNPLPEDFSVSCVELRDGQAIDERCYPELQRMMDDCRKAGLSPYICSSYRTYEKQVRLFEENVAELIAQGYTEEEAREKTAQSVARPGTSEHQFGLAVDIVDVSYQVLDEKQEETQVQQWLMEHSWEYGFILRYPSDKSAITGITYEPWHYRYVGRETAEIIHEKGLCIEEYYEKYLLP